jgi:hypothetical protein
MKFYLFIFFMLIAIDGKAQGARIAKKECEKIIVQKWEKQGTDKYGRQSSQKFVGWMPTGPYGPGKYGNNNFYVFNLALSKNGDIIEFSVDCIFDESGRILGVEMRND